MARTTFPPPPGASEVADRPSSDPPLVLARRLRSPSDLAKFTASVALLAIFSDAALGHALLWENDPYWTYWITKTFLIATVFGLGTAWLGIGAVRGAVITAVHGLILTIYYWTLSPIGLPSHPEWLDLEHTWVTGVPVHFAVIYLGYLAALWLWRRRERMRARHDPSSVGVGALALQALVVGLGVVVVGGSLVSFALNDFPGVTWFLVRLLIAVPFLLGWWAFAGRDRAAAVAGGITLALIFATYSHFLGPVGLPDFPLRVLEQAPPEATMEWLSYREEWLISMPILLFASVAALLVSSRTDEPYALSAAAPYTRALWLTLALTLVASGAAGAMAFRHNEPAGDPGAVSAEGSAVVESGPWYSDNFEAADGELTLEVRNSNPRVTPLPPHDEVELEARFDGPDGEIYEVIAEAPMVEDPLGRHTTWWGVGLHTSHHGASGIGSSELPAVHSEIAVFALGEVTSSGGAVIASDVPVHVMTTTEELPGLPGRLELDVGDPDVTVAGLPDGHLRVVWDQYSGGAGQGPRRSRNVFGSVVTLGLIVVALLSIGREQRAHA